MNNKHPLLKIVKEQEKGVAKGIFSVCSANKYVLEATMAKGLEKNQHILIEATCNQVNQFGGYTGMKPKDFKEFVYSIADKKNFPHEKIILAGDHLGPNPWKNESAKEAMEKSKEMVRLFVLAGFNKIHLDASMHLASDDKSKPLDAKVAAERSAIMCEAAEKAYLELKEKNKDVIAPVYVIGTEVPIPGGMQDEEEGLKVTKLEDFVNTVEVSKKAFLKYALDNAWDRVVAVVVQPGVEFGESDIIEYDRSKVKHLIEVIKDYPNLVFEGHSTDYQNPKALKELVEDGVAILKVGPALTFAVREALYALSKIEEEICKYDANISLSNFIEVLDMAMIQNPENWNKHYHGFEKEVKLARKYSLSDRSRYYYLIPEVGEAIERLITNLKTKGIPLTLLSQYLPIQYFKVRTREICNDPEVLIIDSVIHVLEGYDYACDPSKEKCDLVV